MLDWKITATQDEDSWFDDYLRAYIGSDLPHLPPHHTKVGAVTAAWVEPQPGFFTLELNGGSPSDRWFADQYLSTILSSHGLERQMFELEPMEKTAEYQDVEQKGQRILQSGNVHFQVNNSDYAKALVEGDHGTYETEIWKDAPKPNGEPSESLSRWNCECEWGQFAWGRTRQWKRFEGRPCAHVLAVYWGARGLPQEHEQIPENWTEEPATGEGGPSGPAAQRIEQGEYPGAGGMVPPGASPGLMQGPQVPEQVQQGMPPGQSPEVLPPYPAAPENMPAVNPVSVPGQKMQSPLNPVQNAGGTFSHVSGPPKKPPNLRKGNDKKNCGNCTMFWQGKCWGYNRYKVSADELCDSWDPEHKTSAEQPYTNGDMVRLKNDDVGTWVGLNGGGPASIPKGEVGEVMGTHPSTGLVNVLYSGPAAEHGPLEPHGATCWHWPDDIVPAPEVRKPGPAIRRRR